MKLSKRSQKGTLKALKQAGVIRSPRRVRRVTDSEWYLLKALRKAFPDVPRRWFALVVNGRIVQEIYESFPRAARREFSRMHGKLPAGVRVLPSTGKNKLEQPEQLEQ